MSKGSKQRPTNRTRFDSNWDKIKWTKENHEKRDDKSLDEVVIPEFLKEQAC